MTHLKFPWLTLLHLNASKTRSSTICLEYCVIWKETKINPSSPVNKAKTLQDKKLCIYIIVIKKTNILIVSSGEKLTWSCQEPVRSKNPSSVRLSLQNNMKNWVSSTDCNHQSLLTQRFIIRKCIGYQIYHSNARQNEKSMKHLHVGFISIKDLKNPTSLNTKKNVIITTVKIIVWKHYYFLI